MSESDRDLLASVRRLWRSLRNRVLLEGTVKVGLAVLLALLLGGGLTLLLGAGSKVVVTVRVVGYLLIIAALVRYLVVPALARPDTRRVALYVEEQAPELEQALVSAVHELNTPEAERASGTLSELVVKEAL